MDCGDEGHILVSRSTAEIIGQLNAWRELLHDLDEAEIKHGIKVHLLVFMAMGLETLNYPRSFN